VVFSQPNMPTWVIRLRLLGDGSERACRILHARVRQDVLLGGIDGIRDSRAVDLKSSAVDPDSGAILAVSEMVVDTEGSSLMKVATRDWADWERTVTNDVGEVTRTLGIVAARAVLFAELDRVISYDGGYVDARHLRALAFTMTHRGYCMATTRHGINRVDFSVLQRASYEEPVDMIIQAAVTAEHDNMNGTCQAIVGGQKVPVGTGTVSLQQDIEPDQVQMGRQRIVVSSRESAAAGQNSSGKRLRENLLRRGDHGSAPSLPYRTTRVAEDAWKHGGAPRASCTGATSLPSSADIWGGLLSGRTVATNAFGISEMDAAAAAAPAPAEVPAVEIQAPYRPSSPSFLFEDSPKRQCVR